MADRLGNPEILLNPVETLLRLDANMAHPTFLNQPFIQTPKAEPNADLDFSAGQVLYEHKGINAWKKFFHYAGGFWFNFYFGALPMLKFYCAKVAPLEYSYKFKEALLDMSVATATDTYGFTPVLWPL